MSAPSRVAAAIVSPSRCIGWARAPSLATLCWTRWCLRSSTSRQQASHAQQHLATAATLFQVLWVSMVLTPAVSLISLGFGGVPGSSSGPGIPGSGTLPGNFVAPGLRGVRGTVSQRSLRVSEAVVIGTAGLRARVLSAWDSPGTRRRALTQ